MMVMTFLELFVHYAYENSDAGFISKDIIY